MVDASTRYSTRTPSTNASQEPMHSVEIVATAEPTRIDSWYKPGTIDIFFLGIAIVLSGQYMLWNIGLVAGVYTYLILFFVIALAYITFCCCMAELTSALPFAGGSYGLARCTLGFFPAFLIGCAESLEYTMCVAILANCVVDIISNAMPSVASYKPLLWLSVFFIPTTIIQCLGGSSFWIISTSIGIFQMVLLMIYNLGLLGQVNFTENALKDPTMRFIGGADMVISIFPVSSWFFIGIESLNLASNDVLRPKTQVPHGQVACVCALFITGLWTYFTTVSLPVEGGIATIAGVLGPLNNGFQRLFPVNPVYITLLSLPAQYAGGFGFCWASSKLISSMGRSRLLPPWLGSTSKRFGTPHWAIITTSVLAYGVCLVVYYEPALTQYILPVCLLFTFLSYTGQCIGYILLTIRYPIKSHCEFKNPFGLVGAVYSLIVWLLGIVAIVGFQGHHGIEVLVFAVVAISLGVYYQLVAKKRQTISEEESKVLLVAHIVFFNKRKKPNRGSRGSSTRTSTRSGVRTNIAKVAVNTSIHPDDSVIPRDKGTI